MSREQPLSNVINQRPRAQFIDKRCTMKKLLFVGIPTIVIAAIAAIIVRFAYPGMFTHIYSVTAAFLRMHSLIIGVVILIGIVSVIFYASRMLIDWYRKRLYKKRKDEVEADKLVGIYLDPITVRVVLRPLFSITAGMAIAYVLYGLDRWIGSDLFSQWWFAPLLGALLSVLIWLPDSKAGTVPKNYAAIVTVLGLRFHVYLKEGFYNWYGERIGIGISTDPIPASQHATTEEGEYEYPDEAKGFVYLGNRTINIWHSSKDKTTKLANVAADSSSVFNTLTFTFRVRAPLWWANADDPILDIAERARSAFRTLVSFFAGADVPALKSITSSIMEGKWFYAAFTTKLVDQHPRGSVVQDDSGRRIFKIAKAKPSKEEEDEIIADIQKEIRETGDEDMRNYAPREGEIRVQHREVLDHMIPVMTQNGAFFVDSSVSSVELSEEVAKQANAAAGENFQRIAQIQSARANKEAREILAKGLEDPENQMAAMLAGARDGYVDVTYVPAADRLTRAIVAGARKIGGTK
jgi:hypothetical protein